MKILELIRSFFSTISTQSIFQRSFTYQNDDIGIRSPNAPAGVLVDESGKTSVFSFNNSLCIDKDATIINSKEIKVSSRSVDVETESLKDFRIHNRSFNEHIFYNNAPLILCINPELFSTLNVVNDKGEKVKLNSIFTTEYLTHEPAEHTPNSFNLIKHLDFIPRWWD